MNKRRTNKHKKMTFKSIIDNTMYIYDRSNSFPDGYRYSFPLIIEDDKGELNIFLLFEAKKDYENFTPVSWIHYNVSQKEFNILNLSDISNYLTKDFSTDQLEFPEVEKDPSYAIMYSEIKNMGEKLVNDALSGKLNKEEYNYYLVRIKQLSPHHQRKFYDSFPLLVRSSDH